MANPEHVDVVRRGASSIQKWRSANRSAVLDVTFSDLSGCNLVAADLVGAEFYGCNLNGANLENANLTYSDLQVANLLAANLARARLNSSDLTGSIIGGYSTIHSSGVHVSMGRRAGRLAYTNFESAIFSATIIIEDDISLALNLDRVKHLGPSLMGLSTVLESQGLIPDKFLRGCGYDPLIQPLLVGDLATRTEAFHTMVLQNKDLQSFRLKSCFISYSHNDAEFANLLRQALNDRKVDYWYAPEHGKWGERIDSQVVSEISLRERVVVICSESSLRKSEWVPFECGKAREREKATGETVLFPVVIDDTLFEKRTPLDKHLSNILAGDFRGATEPGPEFEKRVDRLVEGLKAAEKK